MQIESFEKGEQQKCPICGAPYYAGCEHMRHPEKYIGIKGEPAKIQLGTEGPETEEALEVHRELKGKIIPGEITAEELKSDDIESALEKLTEDKKEYISQIVNAAIEENKNDPAVQEFLEFEKKQSNLPKEVGRAAPVRESLIDTMLILLEQRQKIIPDPKELEESLKKAVISKIRARSEQGMFKLRFRR